MYPYTFEFYILTYIHILLLQLLAFKILKYFKSILRFTLLLHQTVKLFRNANLDLHV